MQGREKVFNRAYNFQIYLSHSTILTLGSVTYNKTAPNRRLVMVHYYYYTHTTMYWFEIVAEE